jgi:copper resistance protein D
MEPDAALIACRFVVYSAALFAWGVSAYLWALVPERLSATVGRKLFWPQWLAAGLVFAVTLAMLPMRAAIIGDGWADAVSPDMLSAVLFETTVGMQLQAQTFVSCLMIAAALSPARHRQRNMAVASALALASFAIIGHAAMDDGWLKVFHHANDVLHLLAGGAWVGALLPVMIILSHGGDSEMRSEAHLALRRFSRAGHLAVAIVLATGVANMLMIVHGLPVHWSLPYQLLLAIKIALVGAMVLLAIVNRYVFAPRMANEDDRGLSALRRGTIAEIVLALVVVALVAAFGMLQPV